MKVTIDDAIAVVLGPESVENLRLASALRTLLGAERVARDLEAEHAAARLDAAESTPAVVFVDVYGFDLGTITHWIGGVRERHPHVVFCTYVDDAVDAPRRSELPEDWARRLEHYYALHRVEDDEEFETDLRLAWRQAAWEAVHDLTSEPIRLTRPFAEGILPTAQEARPPSDATVFASYSHADWPSVSGVVEYLADAGLRIWIDRGSIVGGDDWFDAVGDALKQCRACLLFLSPDAVRSKYVKIEYRFFLNKDKPIVPVLIRDTDDLPAELSNIQYFDFSREPGDRSYDELTLALRRLL